MREIAELYPDWIKITATDEPGPDGVNHHYEVTGLETGTPGTEPKSKIVIEFQNGPVQVAGVNGLTEIVLLQVLADRLKSLQTGPTRSGEGAHALTKVEEALHWLQHRTLARMARGVETP